MGTHLRAVLPSMAEPINFKFLWRQDHLSDYTLVICSNPNEEPEASEAPLDPQQRHESLLNRLVHRPRREPSAQEGLILPQECLWPPSSNQSEPEFMTVFQRRRLLRGEQPGRPLIGATAARQELPAATAAQPSSQTHKRGTSQPPADAAEDPAAAAGSPSPVCTGPTTRSAKRRQPEACGLTEQPIPGADATGTGHRRQQQAANAVQTAAMRQLVNICRNSNGSGSAAAVSAGECTPNAASTGSKRQQGRRGRRRSTTAAAAAAQDAGALGSNGALSPAAGPSGTPPPPAATAGALSSPQPQQQQQQGQQQQPADESAEAAGGASMPTSPAAAAAAAGPSQSAVVVHRELPVHGAVLSAMSEYFRALLQNWQGDEKRLQVVVLEDEVHLAEALVEFMYTGELPSVQHDDMLRLMRLSDKFQVKNCPAACAKRFAETPMEDLSLETVCAIFEWPGFLQDAEPFKGVTAKAWSKLLDLFGDLEAAWQDNTRRQQFLDLPYKALHKLLSSDDLAVTSENTVVVALAEWFNALNKRHGPDGMMYWGGLNRELAELVRLQHLTSTFLGSVLKRVTALNQVATADALQAAARYATANEATRNKLYSMPNRLQRHKVLYAPPRAKSAVQRLEFTWVLELQTVKALIDQFRNTKVTVDRYSEPHYFNGFQWQLVLQVLEPPAKQQAPGQTAAAAAAPAGAAAVDVFVGTTARIQIGGAQHLPDVLYFRGQLAAREVASGDFTFVNRMESGFVCGTAGWGFRNFLRITDWDNEAALRRFFYDGKIHLRCNIDQCE